VLVEPERGELDACRSEPAAFESEAAPAEACSDPAVPSGLGSEPSCCESAALPAELGSVCDGAVSVEVAVDVAAAVSAVEKLRGLSLVARPGEALEGVARPAAVGDARSPG
jgi:hypothetical protein